MEFEFSVPRPKRGGVGKEESKTPTFPIQIEKCIYVCVCIYIIEGNELHCTDHRSLSNSDQSQGEFPQYTLSAKTGKVNLQSLSV